MNARATNGRHDAEEVSPRVGRKEAPSRADVTARLVVHELTAGYTDVPVVSDVTITLAPGEIVALLGANGSGKTTVLRAAMGLLPVSRGSILLDGEDLSRHPVHQRVEKGLAMIPAGRRLFSGMSVEENLKVGGYLHWQSRLLAERMEEVFTLFPEIANRRLHLAGKLSGGEQQMVAIGRALMSRPKALLVDELSLGLAPLVVDRLVPTVERIRDLWGMPVLFVEQDVFRAVELADRAYVLDQGRIVVEGQPKAMAEDRRLIRAYMGI